MASPERIHEARHYGVIDSVELARRWVLPVSWVRDHVRSRAIDPIPHIRFGRYVRFRWGSPELEGWLAEHIVQARPANESCEAHLADRRRIPALEPLSVSMFAWYDSPFSFLCLQLNGRQYEASELANSGNLRGTDLLSRFFPEPTDSRAGIEHHQRSGNRNVEAWSG